MPFLLLFIFFFFNDTATTEIYTLSLHDALPISDLLEHVERLLEIRLSLAREPHDQVRRERHLRHRVADLTHELEVALARVAAVHALENAVRTRLEREVEVLAHLRHVAQRADEPGR